MSRPRRRMIDPALWANPEDGYVRVYDLIQQADALLDKRQGQAALAQGCRNGGGLTARRAGRPDSGCLPQPS